MRPSHALVSGFAAGIICGSLAAVGLAPGQTVKALPLAATADEVRFAVECGRARADLEDFARQYGARRYGDVVRMRTQLDALCPAEQPAGRRL